MFDIFDPVTGQFVFKNFSVYLQGAKMGLAAEASADMAMAGGKRVYENGIFVGYIWAPVESTLNVKSFVPVGGTFYQQQALEALAQGKYAFITAGEIGGRILQFGNMVVRSLKLDTDMKTGSLAMHICFEGGAPGVLRSTQALPLRLGGI
ncbi:MAG TPA: hypothetical protein VG734_25920 [Lacunisphaera sp.]|nr:hypothetical protein [Lacunisphaera sp.]